MAAVELSIAAFMQNARHDLHPLREYSDRMTETGTVKSCRLGSSYDCLIYQWGYTSRLDYGAFSGYVDEYQ
jgi:hypothetical protein